MSELSVFQFRDPVEFVSAALEQKQRANPQFSLRAWSRQLGFKNPSLLGQVLKRQRKLKIELALKISDNLKLEARDRKFFQAQVLFLNCRTPEERELCGREIERLGRPKESSAVLFNYDRFRLIADWIHLAILEVPHLAGFDGTVEFIDRMLEHALSRSQLQKAVDRLVRLGLLNRDAKGKLGRGHDLSVLFDDDVPSEAVSAYHAQVLDRAKAAVTGQRREERDLRTSTVAVRKSQLKRVREILRQAHTDIVALGEGKSGEVMYQIQTSAFRITKKGIDS